MFFAASDGNSGAACAEVDERQVGAHLVTVVADVMIVVAEADLMLCTSPAAGPACEAGGIEMGMQATTGAIDRVVASEGALECRVLGGGTARGLCGSGLVDAVAAGLDLGWIEPSGRLAQGRKLLPLDGPVHLTQRDIRQLQLAKAAISAGLKILLERVGGDRRRLARVNLAGAFGNYVNRDSARRIGLLDYSDDTLEPVGNTALLGAKLALFAPQREAHEIAELSTRIEHVSLAADASFHEVFIDEMGFPD